MALDPEEIVTLLLLAALAIAWNWRLGHWYSCRVDRTGRSPDRIKVKNRRHPAMQRVMEAFGWSPKLVIATSRHAVGNKWVRIHVPRVAQLAHISSPTLGSVEAAQGESHSFRNPRGHRSLPTRAIILSKGSISGRCYYERGEC